MFSKKESDALSVNHLVPEELSNARLNINKLLSK